MCRWLLISLTLLLGCGAGETILPSASLIEKTRILAIRSDPPSVRPGDSMVVDALVAQPLGLQKALTYLWVLCDPRIAREASASCLNQGSLQNPRSFLEPAGPGVFLFEDQEAFEYRVASAQNDESATLFVVLFVSSEFISKDREPPSDLQVAFKTISVQRTDTTRVGNPPVGRILLDGSDVSRLQFAPGRSLQVQYDMETASDRKYRVTWYSDAAWFDSDTTLAVTTSVLEPTILRLPNAPPAGPFSLYAVVRDETGGVSWLQRKVSLDL
jgi:hypothetical protein